MSTAQNVFSFTQIPTARQIARGEISSVRVTVVGYWSSDSITIRPQIVCGQNNKFEIEMTHSSGGRDRKEVECDIQAEENFGIALQGAAKIARQIQAMRVEVLAEFAIYEAELEAAGAAVRDAEAALIASDPSMLVGDALRIMESVKAGSNFKIFRRGETEAAYTLYRSGRFFYLSPEARGSDVAIGKDKLLVLLTGMSARYTELN